MASYQDPWALNLVVDELGHPGQDMTRQTPGDSGLQDPHMGQTGAIAPLMAASFGLGLSFDEFTDNGDSEISAAATAGSFSSFKVEAATPMIAARTPDDPFSETSPPSSAAAGTSVERGREPLSNTSVSAGAGGMGGRGLWKQGSGGARGAAAAKTAAVSIPEFDIYGFNDTSHQAQYERMTFLELAKADMERVNLERDFLDKNARFDTAKVTHAMVHERWARAGAVFEGTSKAANIYFVAEQEAKKRHEAACRDKRVAEARVTEAEERSALARAVVEEAVKTLDTKRAAKRKAEAALQQAFEAKEVAEKRAAAPAFGTSGGSGFSGEGSLSNKRKRDVDGLLPPSTAVTRASNKCADVEQDCPTKGLGSVDDVDMEKEATAEEGQPSAKPPATTGVNALSDEQERQFYMRGLKIERQIRASVASQAYNYVAAKEETPATTTTTITTKAEEQAYSAAADTTTSQPQAATTTTTAALELALEAADSDLAAADGSMKAAAVSSGRAAAELDSVRLAPDLQGAVRAVAETADAHQDALDKAGLYVSWVNNEVLAQRGLRAWSDKLFRAAVLAWDAREKARKALNRAGERMSRAVCLLQGFPRGEQMNVSRHALFTAVVENQHQLCQLNALKREEEEEAALIG
ncbi:hypothetical protein Esi_0070_0051 [Ectocarpus siliculosus]|uniref:Uncharacterized protein n=1 Tax=Ectocarpus siliculosus TaxID=2880 RepID=D8LS66_ECTSI|nr:hypothetical protein Esi_0070_0051 [Ectocarpus siliculosus]|eukprot:CBN75123.1 hypothetical protein Esi_0070_0051 [Ectocarpus siliculosus]